jgi:hypothetical protein
MPAHSLNSPLHILCEAEQSRLEDGQAPASFSPQYYHSKHLTHLDHAIPNGGFLLTVQRDRLAGDMARQPRRLGPDTVSESMLNFKASMARMTVVRRRNSCFARPCLPRGRGYLYTCGLGEIADSESYQRFGKVLAVGVGHRVIIPVRFTLLYGKSRGLMLSVRDLRQIG